MVEACRRRAAVPVRVVLLHLLDAQRQQVVQPVKLADQFGQRDLVVLPAHPGLEELHAHRYASGFVVFLGSTSLKKTGPEIA